LLKDNEVEGLVSKLRELKYTDREIKDAVFLINLLDFRPEEIYEFKREMIKGGLSRKQITHWAKMNHLDMDLIRKIVDHEMGQKAHEMMGREELFGDEMGDKVKNLETVRFMKKIKY
jgi:hypothetical protein